MIHRGIAILCLVLFGCNERGGHADLPGSPQAVRRANGIAAGLIRKGGESSDWRSAYLDIPCADCPNRQGIADLLIKKGFQGKDCLWFKKDDHEVYIVYIYCSPSSVIIIAKQVWGDAAVATSPAAFFELWGTPDLWVR